MNYIIINGVNSNTIPGLLIQELPPVSKPKIRTQIDEIDGRDGDIVTRLGYSAFEKNLKIGLYGSFDINQIIKYFNASGKVTFSNESDKYYNFEILDQIDFERLIRFRQATVKFHCQPFKYPAAEAPVIKTTGTTASITNAGNYISRPLITITGTGTITVSLENTQIFNITLGDTSETIIIDTAAMEAYNNSGNLKNRQVTGDYSKFVLEPGSNGISWTGSVTEIKIEKYSRWL